MLRYVAISNDPDVSEEHNIIFKNGEDTLTLENESTTFIRNVRIV
jgi:hypothetical protein